MPIQATPRPILFGLGGLRAGGTGTRAGVAPWMAPNLPAQVPYFEVTQDWSPYKATTYLAPSSSVGVMVGIPRFNDLLGATMIADMVSYSPPTVQLRTEAPPPRVADLVVVTVGGVWTPGGPIVLLMPSSLVDTTPVTMQPVAPFVARDWPTRTFTVLAPATAAGMLAPTPQPVAAFYPQPWSAQVSVGIPFATVAGEITRPRAGVETFYPRAWLAGAATVLATRTAGAVVQIVAVIDTFLPRAWLARVDVTLARASIARLTQVVEPAETLLPMAWPARAQTTVEARTWGGEVRRTPQPVETFLPRSWGAQAAIQKALGTGTYLIRVDQPVQEFPYGAWMVHIDVRQLQTTNLNFPGLGSLTVLYPPAEAPITPADVSTWIHRARRRGRR